MIVNELSGSKAHPVLNRNAADRKNLVTLHGNSLHGCSGSLDDGTVCLLDFDGGSGADASHGYGDIHIHGASCRLLGEIDGNVVCRRRCGRHQEAVLVVQRICAGNRIAGLENKLAGCNGDIGEGELENAHGGLEAVNIRSRLLADHWNLHGREIAAVYSVCIGKGNGVGAVCTSLDKFGRIQGIADCVPFAPGRSSGQGESGRCAVGICVIAIEIGSLGGVGIAVNQKFDLIPRLPRESGGRA